ncbi:MAG: alpha/beta hydrolase [Burkholderiales bacterium]|nr:alpha/beta hydrolase [Burkholderiales bacterium]
MSADFDDAPDPAVEEQPVRLTAADGCALGACLYRPRAEAPAQRVAVVHGGAGIPARYYRRFARFLAREGIAVLLYDYRGIGASRPPTLRGFCAQVEDWAEYDCSAAIAWLRARYPSAELIGIAHSVGALLFGGADNAGEQARLVLVGAHTGYYGDYRPLYRLPMALLWHGVMPVLTRFVGYFPARRLGLGDDIPAGVALQWASRRRAEVRSAAGAGERTERLLARCASLARPALVLRFSDDAFATAAGTRRLLGYYPRLSPEHVEWRPEELGVRRIGHFGFFGRRVGALAWPRLRDWVRAPHGALAVPRAAPLAARPA